MVADHDSVMAPPDEIRTGGWDGPVDGSAVSPGQVTLSGWYVGTDPSKPPKVTVRHQGSLLGETTATQPRPDVAAALGAYYATSGWMMDVLVPAKGGPIVLEAVVTVDGEDRPIGQRTYLVDADPVALPEGTLDHPAPGEVIAGQVIPVVGWALPGGEIAESIDLFVNDEPPVRIRRCSPRLDIEAAEVFEPGLGVAVGFAENVPVTAFERPGEVTMTVRATGRSGSIWHSPSVTVSLVDDLPDAYKEPLARTPLRPKPANQSRIDGAPRVVAVTHSLTLGGGQLYLQELLTRLVDKNVAELTVISPADGPLREELEAAGIGVHVTAPYPVAHSTYNGRVAELAAVISSWEPDLVIANTLGVFPAVDASLAAGLPVVWAIHESFDLDVYAYLNWPPLGLHPEIHRRLLENLAGSELVVFESEATHQMYAAAVPGLKGRRVMYGIDLTEVARYEAEHDRDAVRTAHGFGPEHQVLLCMGVMEERKAQLALVEAFSAIAGSDPLARLVIVGDHESDYAEAVRALVAARGLDDSVMLIPIVPDTYEWYLCADVLVSASDTESLPRSVLEAMAFGRPVLAVDVFGLSEVVVDGVNGWLCEPRDGGSLLAGLRRVLDCDVKDLATLSERCRKDAQGFDGDGYAEAFAEIIRTLSDRTA